MSKKILVFCVFWSILFFSMNYTYSEETTPDVNSSDVANPTVPNSQEPSNSENTATQTNSPEENKPENTKPPKAQTKKKKVSKKPPEETAPPEKIENKNVNTDSEKSSTEPQISPGTDIKSDISLPDLSDYKSLNSFNNSDIPSNRVNPIGEKLIKGIISWVLMIAGILLIIWIILYNRKIPTEKDIKLKRKKHLYYKNSRRK